MPSRTSRNTKTQFPMPGSTREMNTEENLRQKWIEELVDCLRASIELEHDYLLEHADLIRMREAFPRAV